MGFGLELPTSSGISSLVSSFLPFCHLRAPFDPLTISHDHPWSGYGYFLEQHIVCILHNNYLEFSPGNERYQARKSMEKLSCTSHVAILKGKGSKPQGCTQVYF